MSRDWLFNKSQRCIVLTLIPKEAWTTYVHTRPKLQPSDYVTNQVSCTKGG
jgi:hypothetical protein